MQFVQTTMHTKSNFVTGKFGVFGKINQIKTDFLYFNFPNIRPIIEIENWRVLHLEEIAAMKLFAILNRGEKKDYVDVACLLEKYKLSDLFGFYNEKYGGTDTSLFLRFLVSFSDIDFQPNPILLNSEKWEEYKLIITNAVMEYRNT